MKKKLLSIGVLALIGLTTLPSCNSPVAPKAPVPTNPKVAVLTTDMAPAQVSFKYHSSSEIKVDWGDGVLVKYPKNDALTEAVGSLKGKEIKIYSDIKENLKGLSFADREITSIDVDNAYYLNYLDVSHNKLSKFSAPNSTGLKTLNVSYNNLISLDLNKNIYIDKVVALRNNLTSLDVSQLRYLSYIDVSYNNIKKAEMNKLVGALRSQFMDRKSTAIIGLGGNEAPDEAVKNSVSQYWDIFFGNN